MQTSPDTICGFKVIRELGRGAMGVVYLAVQEALGRQLAIKVMAREYTQDGEFVARFQRESQIAARLRHPNIVQIYDFAVHDGIPYIAMEYLGSATMKSLIQDEGRVSVDKSVHLTDQLLSALEHAHGLGIIHRDIKPANVMVTDSGDAALTDFSISYMVTANQLTQTGTVMGTPEYMAPEQLDGRYDARSDIYATGVILYEMLTGISPFRADTVSAVVKKQLFNVPDSPTELDFTVPEELSKLVLKSLEKEPQHRYQTATEMRTALREFTSGVATVVHKPIAEKASVPRVTLAGSGKPASVVLKPPVASTGKSPTTRDQSQSTLPATPKESTAQDLSPAKVAIRPAAPTGMSHPDEPDTVVAAPLVATTAQRAETLMESAAKAGQVTPKSNGANSLSRAGKTSPPEALEQRQVTAEVGSRSGLRLSWPFLALLGVVGGIGAICAALIPRNTTVPVAQPGQGQLVFSVTPQPIQLTIDGTPHPQPIHSGTIVALPEGKHKLGLQAQQHKPLEQWVYVSPGTAKPVEAKLEWTVGNLTVSALPKGSTLVVNGKACVSGQPVLDLAPGNYTVKASKEGFFPQQKLFSVVAGKTVKQSITLKAKPKPVEPVRPVVTVPEDPVPYYPPERPVYNPPPPGPGPGPGPDIWR